MFRRLLGIAGARAGISGRGSQPTYSGRVKHLVCLAEADKGYDISEQAGRIKAFRSKYNLTDKQFTDLSGILGAEYSSLQYLSNDADAIATRRLRDACITSDKTPAGKIK